MKNNKEQKTEDNKFDVVLMNPPYQKPTNSIGAGQSLWAGFVEKALQLITKDGHICAIHPSGWRGNVSLSDLTSKMTSKQIEYLEIHNEQDGKKTFGATTRYDWYVLKNCKNTKNTTIKDQNGIISSVNLDKMNVIPNMHIDKIESLIEKHDKERVSILANYNYSTVKKIVKETKDNEFIYPVIYSTPIKGPTIWYSNTKQNGHFGVKKVILNPSRPIGFVKDYDGEYAMSEYCIGIVCDDNKMVDAVAKVIENQKTNGFADIMEACHFTNKVFNKYVISNFRKDFWKEFVNEDGNEI